MKIVIAGTGYVGLVTGVCLAHQGIHDIVCVDVDQSRIDMLNNKKSPIYEKDLDRLLTETINSGKISFTTNIEESYRDADCIFIAVGTPERMDGSANLEYIKKVSKQIASNIKKDCLVVIKSTVPCGTNEMIEEYIIKHLESDVWIQVASNPEFLAQGSAVNDTLNAKRLVFGVESKRAENILRDVYQGFDMPIISTNRASAEMIKYASNDFLALKISYMNDIANLCEMVGANVEDVALGMSYDDRIGSKFLNPGIGYGGSCFPKDTKALHWLSNFNGYELKTIKAAIEVNELQKLKLVRKASSIVDSFEGLKVAILGLTYKPCTDDLREAPSIVNIDYLIERGADVHAFDPVGLENAKKIFGEKIKYYTDIDSTIEDADMCFIMTEWNEIKEYDIHSFEKLMKHPIVFDGRNCFTLDDVAKTGIEYYSIGR